MLAKFIPHPPTLIGPIGVFTTRALPMLAMRAACGFPSPAEDFFREEDRLDLVLREIAEGKLQSEYDFDALAREKGI